MVIVISCVETYHRDVGCRRRAIMRSIGFNKCVSQDIRRSVAPILDSTYFVRRKANHAVREDLFIIASEAFLQARESHRSQILVFLFSYNYKTRMWMSDETEASSRLPL
jgi:hypothetical protein